jgi:Uncharacterized bacitracin resistance protein
MSELQTVLLALIQGLTEFLPVSNAAHLVLVPKLLGWAEPGLDFDVAARFGTLLAVIFYFHTQLLHLGKAWVKSLSLQKMDESGRLAWYIILATIPSAGIGLLFGELLTFYLRVPLVIATATIFFALVLWIGDRYGEKKQHLVDLTLVQAIVIGLAQAMAMIPGTSRVGITLTAALFLGLTSQAAATFAFLLSIPMIVMAGVYELRMVLLVGVEMDPQQMLIGMVIAFFSALLVIHLFLKMLTRMGLWPFVAYRLVLGGVLLWLFLPPYLSALLP